MLGRGTAHCKGSGLSRGTQGHRARSGVGRREDGSKGWVACTSAVDGEGAGVGSPTLAARYQIPCPFLEMGRKQFSVATAPRSSSASGSLGANPVPETDSATNGGAPLRRDLGFAMHEQRHANF